MSLIGSNDPVYRDLVDLASDGHRQYFLRAEPRLHAASAKELVHPSKPDETYPAPPAYLMPHTHLRSHLSAHLLDTVHIPLALNKCAAAYCVGHEGQALLHWQRVAVGHVAGSLYTGLGVSCQFDIRVYRDAGDGSSLVEFHSSAGDRACAAELFRSWKSWMTNAPARRVFRAEETEKQQQQQTNEVSHDALSALYSMACCEYVDVARQGAAELVATARSGDLFRSDLLSLLRPALAHLFASDDEDLARHGLVIWEYARQCRPVAETEGVGRLLDSLVQDSRLVACLERLSTHPHQRTDASSPDCLSRRDLAQRAHRLLISIV